MNIKAAKTDTLSSGVNTKRFASTSAVDVRPPLFALSRLTGVIGAEISGVDLGATLDDATIIAHRDIQGSELRCYKSLGDVPPLVLLHESCNSHHCGLLEFSGVIDARSCRYNFYMCAAHGYVSN